MTSRSAGSEAENNTDVDNKTFCGPSSSNPHCSVLPFGGQFTQTQSTRKQDIDETYNHIASKQVHRMQLEFAPMWLIKEAFEKEHDENWIGAYTKVEETRVPLQANLAGYHVVYIITQDVDGRKMLKAKICPHGNEDSHKDEIL